MRYIYEAFDIARDKVWYKIANKVRVKTTDEVRRIFNNELTDCILDIVWIETRGEIMKDML